MTIETSDFDAAKSVSETLKGMDKERQKKILRWVAESLGLETTTTPLLRVDPASAGLPNSLVQPTAPAQPKGLDIKSFVESKRPKSDVQFATVVAYFYRFEEQLPARKETINVETLLEAARLAGRRRPPSPKSTLNNAKNLGYLDSAEPGQFRINSVGENLVAMTLPGNETPAKRSRPKKLRKVVKKK